jgi:hypothetical protein
VVGLDEFGPAPQDRGDGGEQPSAAGQIKIFACDFTRDVRTVSSDLGSCLLIDVGGSGIANSPRPDTICKARGVSSRAPESHKIQRDSCNCGSAGSR